MNGAVVAFAGPFAHTAGVLAGALGDHQTARRLLEQSIDTAQRLGAAVWVKQGEIAKDSLTAQHGDPIDGRAEEPDGECAALTRAGKVWTVSWGQEHGNLPHMKGLADLAVLLQHRGQEVSAMHLTGGVKRSGSSQELIDLEALDAYRTRLDNLSTEIDQADTAADIGRVEMLEIEREQLLVEIRRTTGLGGRLRSNPNDPAERARKAVSARIRDAIRRVDTVAPLLAAHLDRSIQTGLRCSYTPANDEAPISWNVQS